MTRRRHWRGYATCGALLLMQAVAQLAAAQSPAPAIDPNVSPASLNRPAAPSAAQSVRFARRPSHVGDQVEQTVAREMRLTTIRRQGVQVVETSTRTMRSRQQRQVTTTRADNGRAQAVLVRYIEATTQVDAGPAPAASNPQDAQPPAIEPSITKEPVADKAYRCWRDGEKLVVTDDEGHTPPPAEAEIVAADMDAVGRPNPFADYLAGRSVAVGETLTVPSELAGRLLALDGRFGKVTQFTLTLREIRNDSGTACAVFQASIEAASTSASQMRLIVDGQLVVEIDSCRAVHSGLSGPLAMSESRGSYSAAYQLVSTGKLSTSISSTYRDAK